MTLREAIDKADNEKPNQFKEDQKIDWLSEVDMNIFNDIIMEHCPLPEVIFEGYKAENIDDGLIAKAPYDALYVAYLKMRIDEANEETARYNNDAAIYNAQLTNFEKFYHKTHKSVKKPIYRIWG